MGGRERKKQMSGCDNWKGPGGPTSIPILFFRGFLSPSYTDRQSAGSLVRARGWQRWTRTHSGPLTPSEWCEIQCALLRNGGERGGLGRVGGEK